MGIGDWGLGIGDWGLGQSPIPNNYLKKNNINDNLNINKYFIINK